jgi:hypothetical protein
VDGSGGDPARSRDHQHRIDSLVPLIYSICNGVPQGALFCYPASRNALISIVQVQKQKKFSFFLLLLLMST